MPDYKLGKIYQIWSPNTDKVYIGSTVQPLHKRFHDHKTKLTGKMYTTAREVLKCGEAKIELIEDYPCEKKSELNRREGQVMRGYDNRVNRCIAGRTPAEWYADNLLRPEVKDRRAAYSKQYQQRPEIKERRAAQARERCQRPEVREHIAAQRKDWEQKPEVKARRAARRKELRQLKKAEQQPEVREHTAAYKKEYYQQNKERIAAQQKEWEQRPEVRERRNAQARERRQRKKEQQQTASA